MTTCFFISDLHGKSSRYHSLFRAILLERPTAVFLGGDIMPGFSAYIRRQQEHKDFLGDFLRPQMFKLKDAMGEDYPRIFIILGNDDGRQVEAEILQLEDEGIWEYLHFRRRELAGYNIFGYSFVPPTPFRLKDWEKYDVSRYVDPGCLSPEEGAYTVDLPLQEKCNSTIALDLGKLLSSEDLAKSVFLFHSPPYNTSLDRAALDGKMVDQIPLDVHVGSIAIRRMIETLQPVLTLHGHIHESSRLTGQWRENIGRTHCFSAAYDGPELALIKFHLEKPEKAIRVLI